MLSPFVSLLDAMVGGIRVMNVIYIPPMTGY